MVRAGDAQLLAWCLMSTPNPEVEEWLKVAVLAFVDAILREIPEAQAYINSRNLTLFSAGVADWDIR